ncbi:MAG TPA: NADP-dependent malic enzyme [Candidatus Acidoferrum sp.]|nr:NADP-dependent malic enzyme [Candidatus Acidoferrum sp.]
MARKQDAIEYHKGGRPGKLEVVPTKPLDTQRDLSLAYTPGVAVPCLEIAADPEKGWDYTARGNLVAVITNGTAVLGLGHIGPLAGKPVMEGKACLFKKFADIDVFDLELAETSVDKFVDVVAALEPTFGGINLEDVKAPECFEIEEKLRKRLSIPVFHDDQHGTAIITGAALLNACEVAHKKMDEIKVVVSGAGASAIACVNFFVQLGLDPARVILVDSKGVVHEGRSDLNPHKARYAVADTGRRSLSDAMTGADVFLGLSIGGVVTKDMVRTMADRPIIFAMANPDPEISYPDAIDARPDAVVATGRSDYPNQVNNVLGFPFIFRGALDVRATAISEEMKVAAARALAALAHEPVSERVLQAYGGKTIRFGPDYLIPKPFDERVLWWVAPAVAEAAMKSGVARTQIDIEAYRERLRRKSGDAAYSITRGMITAAKREPKRIVFPEASSPKLLRALQIIMDEGIARPILLGRQDEIAEECERQDLDLIERGVEIISPRESSLFAGYVKQFHALRQRKGVTLQMARTLLRKTNYFGMMMVRNGHADGLVSGLKLAYPETIRPALQILGLKPGVKVATGMYMMVLKQSVVFFADASINIEPDAEILADIAVQVSDAVRDMGVVPRVAMISFSNFGSVDHAQARLVRDALAVVRERRPDLEVEGEMQADVALSKATLDSMFPFHRLSDAANVLVFPQLIAGNAAYKVLQSLGGASAVGPILLGVARPVTVLQPQAPVNDIVNMTAFTVLTAQQMQRAGRA